MKLTEYIRILVQRGWIMVLLAIIAGSSAFLISRGQTPVYRATQLVLIEPSRTDFGLAQTAGLLLDPSVVYLRSTERAEEIIADLRLDMTPGQLLSNTFIASDRLRLTIQIDVDSTDQQLAGDVARAWGQQLVDYRVELNQQARREDRVNARLVDSPSIGQQAPRPRILGAAGAILGLLVGGVIIFVLEYIENSVVRRREDVERMEMLVMASIPE